jgi:hypothetical protein
MKYEADKCQYIVLGKEYHYLEQIVKVSYSTRIYFFGKYEEVVEEIKILISIPLTLPKSLVYSENKKKICSNKQQ